MFSGSRFWKITDFIVGCALSELIIDDSNFQVLLFLQDNLLESVCKHEIQ